MLRKLRQFSTTRLSLLIAILYALAAYGALQMAIKGTNASPVWPPSGIAFSAVWFLGYRIWPGIWLGAFIANVAVFIQSNGWALAWAVPVSALIGVGNSIEALFGVFLLRSFTEGDLLLFKIRDIFKFVIAVLVACLSSATIGTSVVYFTHPAAGVSFDMIWFTWWLGDVIGIFVVASFFLTFHRKLWQIRSLSNALEAVLIGLVLIIVNAVVFLGKFSEYGVYAHVTYLILPFAIWATYRFGFPGANLSILMTSLFAVFGSVFHLGPFFSRHVPEDVLIVEGLIGIIAVTVLLLAAALYERQKAEEDIKHNEKRFKSLVENSFDVIALVDMEAKLRYLSTQTKTLLGYNNSELLGQSIFKFMHPQDAPGVLEKFQGMLKTPGAIIYAIARMQHKSGHWRWLEGSGHNLLHDPSVGAVVVNYHDITERKLYQDRFQQAVEFSPVAKIMVDREGKILLVNKTAETLLGYSRQELLTMKIENLVPEQSRGNHIIYRAGFHRDPQSRPMGAGRDLYALRKDGRQVSVEIGLVPIETEEGLCVLASIVDITQRKQAEAVLKRDKDSLERLVDERSKELIKTQKELKQFSRLADIGTLAATVAHELRNPLGVIHLAIYNLKREKSDLSANKHLANIEKKAWESNQIIDNLLSYARIKIPNYENVHILQVLDECVATVGGRFSQKGIIIEKHYGDGLDLIEADGNQIREIFLNILNNACQSYTTSGGKVELTAMRQKDMVKVSVQDSGEGIAPEDLDKVFEPFFTRKSKGTGLGLTICQELVNMHQGKIEINSPGRGQGTTSIVLLPVHRRNHDETAAH